MAVGRSARTRDGALARRGFTLIEATISIVIVSAMLVAALGTLGMTARLHRSQAGQEQAVALAHDLLGEILQAYYRDPEAEAAGEPPTFGPEPDEADVTRKHFDDVDDYDGWTEMPAQSRAGSPLAGGDGFERAVTVQFVNPDDPEAAFGPGADTGLKRISVTVTADAGPHVTVVALRAEHSGADDPPVWEATMVRWVGIDLQLGEHGQVVRSGTAVLNQLPLGDGP